MDSDGPSTRCWRCSSACRSAPSPATALAFAEPWKEERRVLNTGGDQPGFDRIAAAPERAGELLKTASLDNPNESQLCFGPRRYAELQLQNESWTRQKGDDGST
jgi:hypothetical protein